ncbi:PREDICTED: membrane frizzled-related protein [Corvus brachyrhynchos]|nr:PREDICTED: membrane frizzled-related protein [Corvus brachyrhynchos]
MKDFTEITLCPEALDRSKTEFCNPVFEGEEPRAAPSAENPPDKDGTGPAPRRDRLGQQLWGQVGWRYRADCKFTWLCVALMSTILLFLISLLLGIVIHQLTSPHPPGAPATALPARGTATTTTAPPRRDPPAPRTAASPGVWLRAESCAWDEHLCDQGLCLQPGFVCDGFHDCTDKSDEANCSLKHRGGRDRPHLQPPAPAAPGGEWGGGGRREGDQEEQTGVVSRLTASHALPSHLPETCSPTEFSCGNGECQALESVCDGWHDCPDGTDELNCTGVSYPAFGSVCEPVEVEMCLGLGYNATSFPNIWLAIPDQEGAAEVLQDYQTLMELACYQHLRLLICSLFVPKCTPDGGVLQPCRAVCLAAELRCQQSLGLLGILWPINCNILPDSNDPVECFQP